MATRRGPTSHLARVRSTQSGVVWRKETESLRRDMAARPTSYICEPSRLRRQVLPGGKASMTAACLVVDLPTSIVDRCVSPLPQILGSSWRAPAPCRGIELSDACVPSSLESYPPHQATQCGATPATLGLRPVVP